MSKSFIWLMIVAIFSTHCNIYHLHRGFNEPKDIQGYVDQSLVNHVVVHMGSVYWELKSIKKVEGGLTGTLIPVSSEVEFYYKMALSRGNFKASNAERESVLQLHIFVNEIQKNGDQAIIPYDKIDFIQVIDKNLGLSALKTLGFAAGGFVVAYGVMLLILCNCPHTYQYDGNNWIYTNTLFTGALNPVLERYDVKQIPDFRPQANECKIQLKNEEKETQYTNFLNLVAVYHNEDEKAVADQKGNYYLFSEEINPVSAKDDNGNSQLALTNELDEATFNFQTVDKKGFSNLYLRFNRAQIKKNSKLVLHIKNTTWSGYLYHEFTKLFGSFYTKWVKSNAHKTKNQLDYNIEKAGIYLSVEMKEGKKWKKLENINLIGEVNFNQLAVSIPEISSRNESIEFRLKCGYNFWETDRVFIANTTPAIDVVNYPANVNNDEEFSKLVSASDKDYLVHKEGEKPYSISFSGLKTEGKRTLFLKSKGYYQSSVSYSGKPQWKKLIEINSVAGLSNFSKEKFEKIAQWSYFFSKVEFAK